jgi:sortase A
MNEQSKAANGKAEVPSQEDKDSKHGRNLWKWIERALFFIGLSLLVVFGAAQLEGWLTSRAALKSLPEDGSVALRASQDGELESSATETVSSGRKRDGAEAYKAGISQKVTAPMAVLQIPKIALKVPLLDGTDELTLNHAVGRIRGTARPGERGNIGIAGHRDGFFRGLKDVRLGDAIELRTANGTSTYVIDQIRIVTPDNVGVLRPRSVDSLTLVTCFPFYFIGSAPQRYIVSASLTHETSSGSGSAMPDSDSQTSNTREKK